jgi:hypothetical protein
MAHLLIVDDFHIIGGGGKETVALCQSIHLVTGGDCIIVSEELVELEEILLTLRGLKFLVPL